MCAHYNRMIQKSVLIPSVLLESYYGNIHLLWAGFLISNICFTTLPCIRGLIMKKRVPEYRRERFINTLIVSLSFLGHAFSMMSGAVRYCLDLFKKKRKPFPSTSVDTLKYSFIEGLKDTWSFLKKNFFIIPVALFCADRGILFITRKGIDIPSVITYCTILFGIILVPVIMTPQFFSRRKQKAGNYSASDRSLKKRGFRTMQTKLPGIENGRIDSDIGEFLSSYKETVSEAVSLSGLPERISCEYEIESCLHSDETGRKEVFLLNRIVDGQKAILRITEDCPEEDALEEAELLKPLNHKGIPKVYDSFEEGTKRYIIREYVEGNSLYDVVRTGGPLSADDIFGIILKLADILKYLHSRKPTVIHRDIKPQNIIVSDNGGIYLIDFGIAGTHKEESRHDTTVVLTHDYAPPEQYGFEQTSPLTDIYSTGVLMLFLATGKVVKSNIDAQVVNNTLRTLIKRCIAFDPKSRLQSVDEISDCILKDRERGKKNVLKAFAVFAVAAAIAFFGVFYYGISVGRQSGIEKGAVQGSETGYIEGFEDAPVFSFGESDTLPDEGNLQCNLSAPGGAFVVTGEYQIFFSDNDSLYRYSEKTGECEYIASVPGASRLSFANGWIYAHSEGNVTQTQIYSSETYTLWKNASELRIIDGEYFIFTPGGTLRLNTEKITCDKLNALCAADIMATDGKFIWYIDTEGSLCRCNFDGTDDRRLGFDDCVSLSLYDGSLYIISGCRLIRLSGDEEYLISEISARQIAVCGRGIYYIDSLDGSIYLSMPDGRIRERISDSRARNINMAGDLIFYHNEDDNGQLWCVNYDGTNDHRVETGD